MITPVKTLEQVQTNLETLHRLSRSKKKAERDFALGLIRNGIAFVIGEVEGTTVFAPSRFVGYQDNSMARHLANKTKNGGTTNTAITRVLEAQRRGSPHLEEEYVKYWRSLARSDAELATYKIPRLFWDTRKSLTSFDAAERDLQRRVNQALKLPPEELLKRLKSAPEFPSTSVTQKKVFNRNATVIAAVLRRADGHCEACRQPAPFLRASDGSPFLEVHHKEPLAEGGKDTVENALALCPNCHRKAHFG